MDPPVSVPRAKGTRPAEVAAAGPANDDAFSGKTILHSKDRANMRKVLMEERSCEFDLSLVPGDHSLLPCQCSVAGDCTAACWELVAMFGRGMPPKSHAPPLLTPHGLTTASLHCDQSTW